jgi:SDR family mycofactocin-dependent oxidoreductase
LGKVALITGAARGQGRSHAIALAKAGADIVAVDALSDVDSIEYGMATSDDLAETVAAVQAAGRRIVSATVDVRDAAGMRASVNRAVASLGRLDVVCANAGVCSAQRWGDVTAELWDDTIAINLTGVWNTVSACLPHLISGGGGSVICISSTAGSKGFPFFTPYVAAKHGVVGLAKSLANELAQFRIRVNTVHPTGVDTAMASGLGPALTVLLEEEPTLAGFFVNPYPVGVVECSDVSNAVVFLATDDSRYVTGAEFRVDAGMSIR